jgi:ATP/maltotriose-dependent transcriptional regulator MalT
LVSCLPLQQRLGRAVLPSITGDPLRILTVAVPASNAEIARGLGIQETTVKTHVAHIQAKLNARDRVQLVVLAHRAGPI